MRITRETLLKLARDTAIQRARADRRITCIYLTGSLRRDDPLLGGTADIDLFIIHSSEPLVEREMVRLSDEVHLDIAHLSSEVYQQPRHLRADPWMGGYLCDNPVVLHDQAHWFEFTQASVNAQFYRPDYVIERSEPLAEVARQNWINLHTGTVGPGPQKLWTYLSALEKAANAIACLTGVPLTERRFLLNYPLRTQLIDRPGLAGGLVDLLTSDQPVPEETWQTWLLGWNAAYQEAGKLETCPPRLHPCRRSYYERAVLALHNDHPEAALWILLRTWTAALCSLPENENHGQSWEAALQTLQLDEEHFPLRLAALDAYLDSVEETLDVWSKTNGV
jgi:hypothetical protein